MQARQRRVEVLGVPQETPKRQCRAARRQARTAKARATLTRRRKSAASTRGCKICRSFYEKRRQDCLCRFRVGQQRAEGIGEGDGQSDVLAQPHDTHEVVNHGGPSSRRGGNSARWMFSNRGDDRKWYASLLLSADQYRSCHRPSPYTSTRTGVIGRHECQSRRFASRVVKSNIPGSSPREREHGFAPYICMCYSGLFAVVRCACGPVERAPFTTREVHRCDLNDLV